MFALARDGIVSDACEGCDIGIIGEVVNADGSVLARYSVNQKEISRKADLENYRDPIKK